MAAGYAAYTGTAVAIAIAALCGREVARTRKLEALAYPFVGLSLAVAFTISLAAGLVKPRVPEATVRQTWEEDTSRLPRSRRAPSLSERWLRVPWQAWALVGVVALAAAVRMWHLAAAPERQLDEITYNSVAVNLIRHGTLNVPLAYRQPWQPFLYHPPFYNVLLSLWDRLLSPTIYSARLLGIVGDVVALLLLSRLLWRLYGKQAALFAVTIVAFDGWLIYVQRISYIENLLLPIVIAALLAYERAVRRGTWPSYLLTGLLLGTASVFNNDGAYLLLVVVVHWAFIRRDTLRHAVALGVALAICGLYALAMISAYTLGGTDWWWHDTLVQIRRITGFQASAGTLNSPAALVHLLGSQYGIFLPSVLVGGAAVILLAVLAVRSMRRRSVQPLGPDLIVPSWAIAALLIFGPATLHFPQYFVLALLPLYCFLWTRTWPWVSKRARPALASVVAVLVLAGLGSSYLRVSQDTSAFAEFQAYAARSIPRHSLIVAGVGDPLGYVIKQPWCSPGTRLSGYCARHASYVVTWQTYLQPPNPLHLASLQRLLDDSRPVKVFRQFSGKLTVWKVK
jgi:4-amino-4-deoxy-L-arabinose transferase-like glycosyltransferase